MLLFGREPQLLSVFTACRRDSKTTSHELSQRRFTRQSARGHVQYLSSGHDKKGLERSRSLLSARPWSTDEISYLQAQAGVNPLNPGDAGGLPSPAVEDKCKMHPGSRDPDISSLQDCRPCFSLKNFPNSVAVF